MSFFIKKMTTVMTAVTTSQAPEDSESSSESEEDEGTEESDRGPSPTPEAISYPPVHIKPTVLGANAGWSNTISTVYYNATMCLMCVGTEEGTLHVHGFNHTWTRPRVGSEYSAIVSIRGAADNKLAILFEDGLLEILELPSLKVLDTLSGMYLGCLPGERLVSTYVDEPGGLPYLYLGTSTGGFHVLDVSSSFSIRICDYKMPSFAEWPLIEMKICPKDARYMALAFNNPSVVGSESNGLVIIYDLAKEKISSRFGITVMSLAWNPEGSALFVGTSRGQVVELGIKQQGNIVVWTYEGEGSGDMQVRKLIWLPPQDPDASADSCLLALLGSNVEGDTYQNPSTGAVIALTPVKGALHDFEEALSFPPPIDEQVLDFLVLPESGSERRPSLLFLSQRQNQEYSESPTHGDTLFQLRPLRFSKSLYLQSCPHTPISDWPLETGMLPEPKPIKRLVEPITTVQSIAVPAYGSILGSHILQSLDRGSGVDVPDTGASRLPLARVSQVAQGALPSRRDLLFTGHAGGSVSIWGIEHVDTSDEEEAGCTSFWRGLSLRNGAGGAAITCIAVFEKYGLLTMGDSEGEVCVWEARSSPKSNWELIFSQRVEGNAAITSVHVVDGVLFAGLASGMLVSGKVQATETRLTPVKGLQQSLREGHFKAVASLYVSHYWLPGRGEVIPALFAVHARGSVHVVSLNTLAVVAYGDVDHLHKGGTGYHLQYSGVEAICVTNGYAEELSRSRRSMPEGTGGAVSSSASGEEESSTPPLEAPKFLIVRCGSDIVHYNLNAFQPLPASSSAKVARGPVSVARRVSNCQLLSASLVDLDDGNASSGTSFTCLIFIDEAGNAGLLSLDRSQNPACYAGLLDSIFKQQRPCTLGAASLCSNGDSYLVKDDIIFTVGVHVPPLSYAVPAPSTVSLTLGSPPWGVEQLLHGREELLARAVGQLEKQRSRTSLFSMSTITDLDKLFASSRPRGLASLEDDGEVDEGEGLTPPSSTASAQAKTTEAMHDMAEARRNMEENREKLQQMSVRGEEMANAAGEFHAGAAANRRKLEARRNKWGIF